MIAQVQPVQSEKEIITGLQKRVSASRLTLFLSCRLKFFFRYIAGITKPKTPALHVGSTVHSVLKAWNKARWKSQPLTLKELHDEYSKAWKDESEGPVKWENAGEEADEQKTGGGSCHRRKRWPRDTSTGAFPTKPRPSRIRN
jgi:putative RecB family exonuclease